MVTNSFKFNFADAANIAAYAKRINDEYESGEIGYYHLPRLGASLMDEIYEYENSLKHIKNVVLVGIGGSSLGVKALDGLLSANGRKRELFFLDNLDTQSYKNVLSSVKFSETLFIISSKSGNTIETITIFKCLLDEFKPQNLSENFLIITDPDTNLQNFAKENDIKYFNIPSNVGGRFSVLSCIGLVPLALCGYDIAQLLSGALACKAQYIIQNDSSIIAKAHHYATHRHANINVVFSYCDRFVKFNDWYVQLWAESLGKKSGYKRIGRTPVGLIGSRDQHSFLQLIMDGVKDKTITFIKVKEQDSGANKPLKVPNFSLKGLESCDFVAGLSLSELLNAQCDATMAALVQEGLSVDMIELERLDEWHAGWLIFYYELLTSATGIMLGINTYDQPGVEIGKRILKTMLSK
ncbi:glucose-6-phosphate isomerase [Campylobacter sp. faydin G-140]|uniref:glucose-6-phosphate isomerase n=1 Tax=Campylobacter anatolicus TaxID=2829105 RepID=UPI001B8F46B7|nr:glucose-6-phosphate isomerase [Campylobacter anatolicus]MBR8465687.1 glucose-6-phosphate isomerase [Campylobacter anatolicus]